MTLDRVIHLLEVKRDYTLKQTGHSQQPINKEVRQALDIAIEAVKQQVDIVRCKDCDNLYFHKAINGSIISRCCVHGIDVQENDFCSYGERKTNDT